LLYLILFTFTYFFRIKIAEFVLVTMNYFRNIRNLIDDYLIKSNFLKLLFEYFFDYEWNNALQFYFDSIIKYMLDNAAHYKEIITYVK